MKFLSIIAPLLPLATVINAGVAGHGGNQDPEVAASKRIDQLQKQYQKVIESTIKHRKTGCTSTTILRRQDCINAVYCLASLPAMTPPSLIPGARTLFDDYVGSHFLRTPFVHSDGFFLPFHRHFVALYGQVLRAECGYAGAQPYWDCSLCSLGGNGVFVPSREPLVLTFPGKDPIVFPLATGGGCVASGPFTADKFSVNLGPVVTSPPGPGAGWGITRGV
ncbi:hypothetical protein B0T17DRAFT_653505 [Bombardia bombarda]|uniref:Tyrosinase copper-binding domain-containing protein n=1 Tax=Bombardia bombarda TaxID=252184 RepID=A0AA39X9S0_9PEZI|nr:hypothetical protein B0T17DRAFT_653505 [Bombardia bombarda]